MKWMVPGVLFKLYKSSAITKELQEAAVYKSAVSW